MSDLTYPAVQQAMKRLQDLSRNEQDRFRALALTLEAVFAGQ